MPADPSDPTTSPHTLARLRFDRLGPLVSDPGGLFEDLYHFGRPDFDGVELFARVKDLVDFPDHEAVVITAPGMPPALDAFVFRLSLTSDPVPGLRVRLRQAAEKDLDLHLPLTGVWSADASAQARFEGGLEFELHPDGEVHIAPPVANASISFAFGVTAAHADGSPMIILGQVGGSRLELETFSARLPLKLSASTGAPSPEASVGAEVTLDKGKLVIDTSNSDGFIAQLLSGVKVESEFDLSALYDTKQGLRFTGSATIEIAIPTHLTIGPVSIASIYLIGGFKDGKVPVEFSADIGANLGPLAASVSRLGALATISFPKGGGNAGVAQIDVSFKPPNGVGLSVDAGIVKGGGFLYIDTERGRVRRRARAHVRRVPEPQGHRHHHDADAGRQSGLLAAHPRHRRVRHRPPAGLGIHPARRWWVARAEPDHAAGRLGRGSPHRVDHERDVPPRRRGERAADHRGPPDVLPAAAGHLPHRSDGQARLGHAHPGEPVARHHHRDPRQRRHRRRAADGLAGRRDRGRRAPGQLHRRH